MRTISILLCWALLFVARQSAANQFCVTDENYYNWGNPVCFATYAQAEAYLLSPKSGMPPSYLDIDQSRFEPEYVELTPSSTYSKVTHYVSRTTAPPFENPGGEQWRGYTGCNGFIGPVGSEQAARDALTNLTGHPFSEYDLVYAYPSTGLYGRTQVYYPTGVEGQARQGIDTLLGDKDYLRGGGNGYCDNEIHYYGGHGYMCRDTDIPSNTQVTLGQVCKSPVHGHIYETTGAIESSETCKAGNPCHPQTGVKTQDESDFEWEGLSLGRSYSSSRELPTNPSFGPAWIPSWDVSARRNQDGTWLVRVGDKLDLYRFDASTGYSYSTDVPGSRFHYANTSTLELADGRTIVLDAPNFSYFTRVLSIYDRASNITYTFQYCQTPSATCSSEAVRSIVSSRGRQLDFIYGDIAAGGVTSNRLLAIGDASVTHVAYGYDASGLLSSATYPTAPVSTRSYRYNEAGRVCVNAAGASLSPCYMTARRPLLTSIIDENGIQYALFKFDNFGRVVSSEHAGAVEKVALSYPSSLSSTVTDATGAVTTYNSQITANFYKLASSTTAGASTSSTYDSNGYLDLATDKLGVVTNYDFDSAGRLTKVIRAQGKPEQQTETTQWDTAVNLPRQVDRVGQRIGYTYNGRGQPLTVTVTDLTVIPNKSRTTSYSYCEQVNVDAGECPRIGLATSIDGPRSDVADIGTLRYYAADDASCATALETCAYRKGDLWKSVDALGHVTEFLKYDSTGRATSVRSFNGVVTDLVFSPRGRLTARKVRGADDATEVDDAVTAIEYDGVGRVSKFTLPDGAFTQFTYDNAHRLTEVKDALGNTITYTLDAAGNRKVEDTKDSAGVLKRTLSQVFNTLGQLQTFKDANLKATGVTYDVRGAVDKVTDPLSRVADSNVDALGRLSQQISNVNNKAVDQATTNFEYDTRDNLTAVIDPKGLTTSYTYDGFDQVTRLVSPDTGITSSAYDPAGNLYAQTDARGITRTMEYDALNRLISVSVPTSSQALAFGYDTPPADCLAGETFGVGRSAYFADESGSTRFCYDRRGLLVRKVQAVAGGSTLTFSPTYNSAGRLSAVTYPSGAIVVYVRDGNGQVTGMGAVPTPGATQVTLISAASYLPFGPLKSLTFGNGRVLTKVYDKNYDVDIVSDSVSGGLSEDFTLDAVGNPTGLVERITGTTSATRGFVYDGLDRVTAQKNGNATVESFKYDTTGNRTSKTSAGVTTTYSYPASSHRLSGTGSIARTYDAAGNATGVGSGTGAPVLVYDDMGRLRDYKLGSVTKASYRYNGKGERVWRIDSANSANNRQYFYDEDGHLLGEYDSAGNRILEYVWLDDTLVAVLSNHDGSTYQFVETDYVGSARAVIHPTKNTIIWRWDVNVTAFGEHAPSADPDNNAIAYTLNLRFPGQIYDSTSGMSYNYFRDYDPAIGRYVESDPIGLEGGESTYGYVDESPLRNIDPLGLEGVNVGTFPPGPQRARFLRPSAYEILDYYHHEMSRTNIKGPSDQVFHCMAACKSKKAGNDVDEIRWLMDRKENVDFLHWAAGGYGKGLTRSEMLEDSENDRRVNEKGLQCPLNLPCIQQCRPYINAMPAGSRSLMQKYLNSKASSRYPG